MRQARIAAHAVQRPRDLAVALASTLLLIAALAPGASAQPRDPLRSDDRAVFPNASEAFFAPRLYLEAGVSVLALDVGAPAPSVSPSDADDRLGGTVRGGIAFNSLFSVEIDATFFESETAFVIPEDGPAGGFQVAEDPDQLAVSYGRVSFPLGEALSVHGRLGYAALDSEIASTGTDDDQGVAFGAGLRYGFGRGARTGLRLDYTRLALDQLDADLATLVLSLQY